MSICNNHGKIKDVLYDEATLLYNASKRYIQIFNSDDMTTTIELIALGREISRILGRMQDTIIGDVTVSIICEAITRSGMDGYMNTIERETDKIMVFMQGLDDSISSIENADFDEIETLVAEYMSAYENNTRDLQKFVESLIRDLFQIFLDFGATLSEVEQAIDSVEFTPDIKSYILEVFNDLLDRVLPRLKL